MQYINFSKINKQDIGSIRTIITLFKEWKNIQFNNTIAITRNDFENKTIEDALKIIDILGERYYTKFLHQTKEELIEWSKKWQKLTCEERKIELKKEVERQPLWDFDSWIDAIINAEIMFYDFAEDGINYKISFEQLAYPSGGIEAMENLIKIYDGEILKNDML